MNTQQIEYILLHDPYVGSRFRGVYSWDKVRRFESGMCVINTAPSSQTTGGHWIALNVGADEAEYFDSYGGDVPKAIKRRWKKKSWVSNPIPLQSPLSAVCGQYCIYYLIHRARGFTLPAITMEFVSDVDYNDQLVYDFVKNRYEFEDLKLLDTGGVFTQLAKACISTPSIRNPSGQ